MDAQRIALNEVSGLIKTGLFVSVDFYKKNGGRRTITGRVGVAKHTNGVGMAYNPAARGMVVIFETTKANRKNEKDKGYRMITLDNVIALRANGKSFVVA